MNAGFKYLCLLVFSILFVTCTTQNKKSTEINAKDILGNPEYLAISYGGYRHSTRDTAPTVEQLKDDMKILAAMGIKMLRTYNTQQYAHAANLLKAIRQLKNEDPSFEMYVMLGTWIECKNAWTNQANHNLGNVENNTAEIETAIEMVNTYPDIVKIIAVGNEAMVHWAIKYYVSPRIILKWVNHLQELKESDRIPADTWITSSDNYESWGGGAQSYQTKELVELIKAVDFVSLHTYPFHDSHNKPAFWGVPSDEENFSDIEKVHAAMLRAKKYAMAQTQSTADYISNLGIKKPIHIGETGWATIAGTSYGAAGSKAADEYKEKLYYQHMRDWTNSAGMSCFYFEAFDEKWKDSGNILGSENHFGLINLKAQAKYVLWDMVDEGVFEGLTRDGMPITKTYGGDESKLLAEILPPPLISEIGILEITTINKKRKSGEKVTEEIYVLVHNSLIPDGENDITYPSSSLLLNAWEGTCGIKMSEDGVIEIITGTGSWWGCALEMKSGIGENLSNFKDGYLNFEIKGNTKSAFVLGFQTGSFAKGNQVNNYVTFGKDNNLTISEEWKMISIPISEFNKGGDLRDITGPIFLRGEKNFDGKKIYLRNVLYTQNKIDK